MVKETDAPLTGFPLLSVAWTVKRSDDPCVLTAGRTLKETAKALEMTEDVDVVEVVIEATVETVLVNVVIVVSEEAALFHKVVPSAKVGAPPPTTTSLVGSAEFWLPPSTPQHDWAEATHPQGSSADATGVQMPACSISMPVPN